MTLSKYRFNITMTFYLHLCKLYRNMPGRGEGLSELIIFFTKFLMHKFLCISVPNLIAKHLTSSPYQLKRSMGRTLWIWDTLPQKGIKSEDQTWINEGDAVENVHRLTIGNNY